MAGCGEDGAWSQWTGRHGPWMAKVLVQLFFALVDVAHKMAYELGMRPLVFVAYRYAVAAATLPLASLAARGCTLRPMAVGAPALALVLLLPGASAGVAVVGLEKVELRSCRSVATIIIGTIICLGGATFMALFKGPKILGAVLASATGDWVKGGIYLIANVFC